MAGARGYFHTENFNNFLRTMRTLEEQINLFETNKENIRDIVMSSGANFQFIYDALPTKEMKTDFYNMMKEQIPSIAKASLGGYNWHDLRKNTQVLFPYVPKKPTVKKQSVPAIEINRRCFTASHHQIY